MDVRERLLRALQELTRDNLRAFVFYLGSVFPRGKLENASPVDLAELLMQYFPERALEVAAETLERVPRMDLVRDLRREEEEEEEEEERAKRVRERTGEETLRAEQPPPPPPPPPAAAAPVQSRRVSDAELMRLARSMGRRWRQIGIEYLGTENSLLEQIEEDNPNNTVMRAFYMLSNWKNRERERATAARLYHILNQEGVQLEHDSYAFLLEST